MCTHDNYGSPYLRRRLRLQEEIVRGEAARSWPENRSKAWAETVTHGPRHEAISDAEPN